MKIANSVKLTVDFVKEGDSVIAYCPSLDLSAYGPTMEEAKKAFETTFALFMEELHEKGTLEEVLLECGWKKNVRPKGARTSTSLWSPPEHLGNIKEDFPIPV